MEIKQRRHDGFAGRDIDKELKIVSNVNLSHLDLVRLNVIIMTQGFYTNFYIGSNELLSVFGHLGSRELAVKPTFSGRFSI